jgi:hypothetical protein
MDASTQELIDDFRRLVRELLASQPGPDGGVGSHQVHRSRRSQ